MDSDGREALRKEMRRALRSGDLERAEASADAAERAGGPSAATRWTLATVARRRGDHDRALERLREAVALDPTFVPAAQDLGAAFMGAGDAEAALAAYRKALSLAPGRTPLRSATLMCMHYCRSVSATEIAEAHREFGRDFPPVPRPPRRSRAIGDPIRIGLVSGDFRRHSTASFLPPFLEGRDPARWHVVLYSNVGVPDAATRRFQALADTWVDAAFLDDDGLASRIAADGIDVLIDLNGHTAGNRLGVFARRPAPLQATWLDYVHSTGLPQIDLLVTDADHVPPDEDERHVERPARLPSGAYRVSLPAGRPAPARRPGPFTFGSFNSFDKVSAEALRAWAEILRAAPQSRLIVAARALDRRHARDRLAATLHASGIRPERVTLLGSADREAFLARYGSIDLHLDSFPYSGGLTTLEAMWMGVPTLTFPGDRIAGRHSAAHLRRAGLSDFVAPDPDAYVEAAVALVRDPRPLHALRLSLRERIARSTLIDGCSQAQELADLLIERL